MKSNKTLWLVAAMLVLSLFLAACAGGGSDDEGGSGDEGSSEDSSSDEGSSDEGSSDEEASGSGGNDLEVAMGADIVSLDPHGNNDVPSSNVRSNIYETLVTQNDDMEVQEGLATDWEQVDDTTWSFTLREGVMFHDGTEFTASAVKANLDRILDPAQASPRTFLYEMITDVSVEGDYEVQITTEYPFAPLLAHLAHDAGGMISEEVIDADYENALSEAEEVDMSVEEYYELRAEGGSEFEEVSGEITEFVGTHVQENPYGTGYYKFDSRTSGESTTLTRYEDYWGEPATLDSVTFKVVPEPGARLAELETGESHIADITPTQKSNVEEGEGMRVEQVPSVSLSYIGFNMQKEPFDNKKVRQAINLAINQEEVIEGIYQGNGTVATGPLAPGVFGYDDSVEGLGYEPDRAQELLNEAGYEDGFETTLWTNDNESRVETAVYVQDVLSEYNIDVEVQELEWGTYLERTANGEHDMFVLGWSTVTGDADYGLYALFHSSAVGSTGNRSFVENEELDQLLDEGRRETDEEKRKEIYSEAQTLLADIAPMVYIHHQDHLKGVRENVENYSVDPLGIHQLKNVEITN
ncbi:glutathione ABC transporter substrate-binding protein [Alkalibacillus almallahensis]|uniref:glutathione ABC transporter substrate-binding protein n=1 Tax=Alkalibacillus almallahensis TaxID=1379154 RepID=UPI001420A805|nr:glutathione ABC transporter substrate-binding protein [Alkalibacillus almallahensis]NIK11933.1 peptide/nickel transport system substrate-binding protein [Alkalibacillus almallahensis]